VKGDNIAPSLSIVPIKSQLDCQAGSFWIIQKRSNPAACTVDNGEDFKASLLGEAALVFKERAIVTINDIGLSSIVGGGYRFIA
jgi:hypothetical protein